MRDLPTAIQDALATRVTEKRDFIWLTAKNRDTGADEEIGFWNGLVPVTTDFIDGFTGVATARAFEAAGALVEVSTIPMTSDLTIREVRVQLSHVSADVAQAVREFDARRAPITIGRGFFDPATKAIYESVEPWFVGFIDDIDIPRLAEGQEGSITVTCRGHTDELTKSSPEVRSQESQLRRASVWGGVEDQFYKDAAAVAEWELFWGQERGKVGTVPGGGGDTAGRH